MATGQTTPTQDPTMFAYVTSDSVAKPEPGKNKPGRKPGSGRATTQKKKTPQRGMGVAQLERLRMEERWKKMTEMSPIDSVNLPNTRCHQYPLLFPDPIPSVPVLHGAANYGVPVNPGGGWPGFDPGVCRMGCNNGGGDGFGIGWGSPVWMGANRVGGKPGFSGGGFMGLVETSRELSSIPNIYHHQNPYMLMPDPCDIRIKKMKRFENGDDHTNIQNEGDVRLVAVHRSSSTGRRNVVMEYEFLAENKSTYSKEEVEFPPEEAAASASASASYDSTLTTATAYGSASASTYVDLSLKL